MSCPLTREDLNRLLRRDFRAFLRFAFAELHPGQPITWTWHLDAICCQLELAMERPGDRLAISLPPRHLKSIVISVAFTAWMLGRNPRLKFLVASYGAELSNELSGYFRTVVTSAWFKSAFPEFKLRRNVEGDIRTTLGGGRKAVSVGGATTGFGADWIIVDDLTKAEAADHPGVREGGIDYFRGSLVTRHNDATTGRIIVVGQRLHEVDILGVCLETGLYRHLNLPAVAQVAGAIHLGRGKVKLLKPGDLLYYDQETLDRKRLEMGPARYVAQYLQEPAAAESLFIKWHKIHRYKEKPPREQFKKVVVSVDPAQVDDPGSDWTACTVWGWLDGKWWLMHLDRFQCDSADLKGRVLVVRQLWEADVLLIEDVGCGKSLISEIRFDRQTSRCRDHGWELTPYRPKDSKPVRWAAQAAKLEAGVALFPEDAEWLDVLRREVMAFPRGRNDDQVDSISQFLDWTRLRTGRTLMAEFNGRSERHEGRRRDPGPRPE